MSAKPVEPVTKKRLSDHEQEELARTVAGRVGKRFGHKIALAALISLAYAFDFDEAALGAHVEELHREAKDTAGPKPSYSKGWPAWEEKVRKAHEELIAREAAKFQKEHDDRVAAAAAKRDAARMAKQADKQDEEHAAAPSESDAPKAPPVEAAAQDKPRRARAKKNADEPSDGAAESAQGDDEPKAASA